MVFLIYSICLLLFKSGFSRNIPPHESFKILYGPSLEYIWRNNSKYHVAIYNQQLFCFSTLLTLEHALTAAGCFVPAGKDVTKMLAYGGTMFYYHQDPRAQVRAVKEVIIHENYSIFGLPDNDVALVVVTSPFVETFRIGAARLPDRLMLNSKDYIPLYINFLRFQDGVMATITMDGIRIKDPSTLECRHCKLYQVGDYYSANGTVVSKLICFKGHSTRYKKKNLMEVYPCYGGLGSPLMNYDTEVIAIQSFSYDKNCSSYPEMPEIYERSSGCGDDFEVRYIQVFYYVDWIRSNIEESSLMKFRPVRISKKINLKPYIALLVYLTLFAIVIVVFLICNRAVFSKIHL